jgi:hypothetical protein
MALGVLLLTTELTDCVLYGAGYPTWHWKCGLVDRRGQKPAGKPFQSSDILDKSGSSLLAKYGQIGVQDHYSILSLFSRGALR